MLAGIALCLATTVILKMQLRDAPPGEGSKVRAGRPAFALIAFLPLVWLLAVTMTAGAQKIFHPKPSLGFLAANRVLREQAPKLEAALASAEAGADETALARARKELRLNRIKRFNNSVDTLATGFFMLLEGMVAVLSIREWILLLARRKPAVLHETAPTWLPEYAVSEARPVRVAGLVALGFVLTKELSGEAQLERARQQAQLCESCHHREGEKHARKSEAQLYAEVTEERYNGVRGCC
jgi:carbon starvation protein